MTALGQVELLLVEDNAVDAILTIRALESLAPDLTVSLIEDGARAVCDLMAGPPPALAAVLLDLNLPGMHGHDVLRALKADVRTRQIPVVVLSSSRDPVERERSLTLGARAHIPKPFALDRYPLAILAILANLEAHAQARDTAP